MPSIDKLKPFVDEVIFTFNVGAQRSDTSACFHLDYCSGIYREKDFTKLLRDSIEYFALTHDEFEEFRATGDIVKARRIAWSRISTARKDKKGDYGELLLFLLLCFKMPDHVPRFVTKVRLRSSRGEQIKGFDCAHVTLESNQLCLWLGEAKFHQSISTGISSAMRSLKEHSKTDYLTNELRILGANCEANHGINERISSELDAALNKGRSLDRINFKIPILLTYDSACVASNTSVCEHFRDQLKTEIQGHLQNIESKNWDLPSNFSLLFCLMPLHTVAKIKSDLEKIEEAML